MWYPKKIEFKNLFAHVDSEYEFKNGLCTVIFGENKDAQDCDNNGAGKSTIFEAIAIALTNKSLRDIDKEVFINRDAENCEITFELCNEVLKSSLKIYRKFFRGGKSAKVEIYENDKRNSQITSVNEANKRIYELIGINREDLLRYFIISQDNNYTFFTAGDVEKKEVLNRITSADMINPILQKLNDEKKNLSLELSDINSKILIANNEIEFFKEQKIQADTINDDYEIKKCNERIEEGKSEIEDLNVKINSFTSKIQDLEKESKGLTPAENVADLQRRKKKIKDSVEEHNENVSEAKSIIRQVNMELSDVVKCPKCNHEFIRESELNLSVKDARKIKDETEELINDLNVKINSKKNKLLEIENLISQQEEIQENLDALQNDIKMYQRKIKNSENEIQEIKDNEKKFIFKIEKIKSESQSAKIIKEIEDKIKDKESDIEKLNLSMSKMNKNIQMLDFWIYYMGKNGFSTYLANRAISIIEGITNYYLKKFHSDLTVEINGYKILKDGSVREKIDVKVLQDGLDGNSFMGYSGGERGRVSLAGVLGIQHLINMSLNGRGLDLLLLDETFHGVDARGQENIIKILENISVTIMMITQNVSSEFQSKNRLMVIRENNVSKFI